MNSAVEKTQAELALFHGFLDDLRRVGAEYEAALFSLCQDFQNKMTKQVKDEKTCQYFQLAVNNLLRYLDGVQRRYETVDTLKKTLRSADKDFTDAMSVHLQVAETNLSNLHQNFEEFERNYKRYIGSSTRSMTLPDNSRQRPGAISQQAVGEQVNVEAEETVIKQFSDLESLLSFNVHHVRKILTESAQKEATLRSRVGKVALGLATALGNGQSGELEGKVRLIDSHLESHRILFEMQGRDESLDFNPQISLTNAEGRFFNYFQFLKIEAHYAQPLNRMVLKRLGELERAVSPKFRVYFDLLADFLYRKNVEFSREVVNDICSAMSQKPLREYLMYLLVLKKNVCLNDRQLVHVHFKREQQKNLTTIAQFFFSSFHSCSEVNFELVLFFLRFSLLVVDDQKDSIIENFARIALLHETDFWQGVIAAIVRLNIKLEASGMSGREKASNIFNSVRLGMDPSRMESRPGQAVRAFEEVALFLFKMQLDFEKIADILMELAPDAGISFDVVKSLLQRNQDLFLNQICEHNFVRKKETQLSRKASRFKETKLNKLIFVLCRVVFYLGNITDLSRLFASNAQIFRKREKITKKLLLSPLMRLPDSHRCHLFLIRTDLNSECLETYRQDAEKDAEQIIILDVKRTTIPATFDAAVLIRVLSNISLRDVGNVQYYQGLNYVTCYFLTLFRGHELIAYRVVVSMLRSRCRRYFDRELKNLRKLFFFIKRLIKQFLPALHSHLEYELKLEIDMVCAAWCLTLFTTALQYSDNRRLLDEIIDIFMAREWVGFCQVVLVIFDELQPRLLKCTYEESVMLLNDVAKTSFRDVEFSTGQNIMGGVSGLLKSSGRTSLEDLGSGRSHSTPQSNFSFKERIRKFREVDQARLTELQVEHEVILEKMDEFWSKLAARIQAQRNSVKKRK
jgi:hypothetical protein